MQYMTPFFAKLANSGEIDLTVLYFTRMGLKDSPVGFTNFHQKVVWDLDLLEGYRSKFLWNPITADGHRRMTVIAPEVFEELLAHATTCS